MSAQHHTANTPHSAVCAFMEMGSDRHKLEAYAVDNGMLSRPLPGHNRIFASFAAAVRFAHKHGYLS
jgi:hypothetical protein